MKSHPGAEAHTRHMLALAGLPKGARVLDMGAGAGEALTLLREYGFDARGIDLEPRSDDVERADFLRAPFPDGSFDAVLSQCAFFVSGDPRAALREAYRLLVKSGAMPERTEWVFIGRSALKDRKCQDVMEEMARLASRAS